MIDPSPKPQNPFDLFGVECGKGWEKLYQPVLDLIQLYGGTVMQVKEKFGLLRIYAVVPAPKGHWIDALIRAVEHASGHTCEECGEDGQDGWDSVKNRPHWKATTSGKGWMRTLCKPCRTKWESRLK